MKSKPARKRLDALLVERGLAESLPKAQGMILAGEVRVEDARAAKAGMSVAENVRVNVISRSQKYASRGGIKLEGALADFSVNPAGRVCLDIGSSTGGFTDCLLQKGAIRVFAVDVNIDQLDWRLQRDSRVTRIERNARELRSEDIPQLVDLVVADVSFISVGKILKPLADLVKTEGDLLILVKPQFELPKASVGVGGLVSDPALHQQAISGVRAAAGSAGLDVIDVRPSRLRGAEGNQEYFLYARKKALE